MSLLLSQRKEIIDDYIRLVKIARNGTWRKVLYVIRKEGTLKTLRLKDILGMDFQEFRHVRRHFFPLALDSKLVIEYGFRSDDYKDNEVIFTKRGDSLSKILDTANFSRLPPTNFGIYDISILIYLKEKNGKSRYVDMYRDLSAYSQIFSAYGMTKIHSSPRSALDDSIDMLRSHNLIKKIEKSTYQKLRDLGGESLHHHQKTVMENLEKPATLGKLIKKTGIPRSSLQRALHHLSTNSYVENMSKGSPTYVLTAGGQDLSNALYQILDLVKA